ncbi:MAG: flagellar FliJ family protein, partial [Rhodospirillaceae bacterium]
MAKGVATLIRVNEWTVDEKRRVLGARLRELDGLENALIKLEAEVVHEQQTAAAAPELAGFLYGNYADAVIHRREQFQAAIASKEQEVQVAREDLNEAYRELKKFEVIDENNRRRADEEQARKD